jgi:hypothetical protein
MVRALPLVLFVLTVSGCSRPPSAETFTAEPLSSSFVALRSPNGQQHVLLVRTGSRWHGRFDDTFAATVRAVVADADDNPSPEVVHPADPAEPSIEVAGWRPVRDLPVLVVEAWAAGDPALRASGPTSLVSMLRVAGDSPQIAAVNSTLASWIESAVGFVSPPGDTLEDPGAIAARVAVEAAIQAVVDEDSGEVNPRARVAVLQIPVLLNRRFLAVEHLLFEDNGTDEGGAGTSRFTLHDLETGGSPDAEATLDAATRAKLLAIAGVTGLGAAWYPSRAGIAFVFRDAPGATIRRVVPWREALLVLPADSPLRAVAESVH